MIWLFIWTLCFCFVLGADGNIVYTSWKESDKKVLDRLGAVIALAVIFALAPFSTALNIGIRFK